MATVRRWSGAEARALRMALRFSVRGFAAHLGIAARTVSKWEAAGASMFPLPDTQAMLDTVLARADTDSQQRFEMLCRSGTPSVPLMRRSQGEEFESWIDDLERALVASSRQDFRSANSLIDRWMTRCPIAELDERGTYLYSRSLVLKGAILRDQGCLSGPGSARTSLLAARECFAGLGIDGRVAQTDLGLTLLDEMSDRPEPAARRYELHSRDERLSASDRGLATMWKGRALSKNPATVDYSIDVLTKAIEVFERLEEPGYWSVAQQKLALAHRARGDLDRALAFIDVAERNRVDAAPLQFVRLNTARAHVLLTDHVTRSDGERLLDSARQAALTYGLRHQLDSIERIQATTVGAG